MRNIEPQMRNCASGKFDVTWKRDLPGSSLRDAPE
jgi:hypothetical protein